MPGDWRGDDFQFETRDPAGAKAALWKGLFAFARRSEWPQTIVDEVDLLLEECFTNINQYGLRGITKPLLIVRVGQRGDEIQIEIEDNGLPFNPLEHPAPDIAVPIGERAIGGLGIFLAKKLADKMAYAHRDGHNVLTMTKRLDKPALKH